MRKSRHWHIVMGLLRDKPHAVGAEVGVFRGIFAEKLLSNLPSIKTYYCIDPWEHDADYKKTLRARSGEIKFPPPRAYRNFVNRTSRWQHKRIILRMTSDEALDHIADGSLDWVFIDANHAYEYARADIIGWSKKVKVGGLISGHDFYDNFARLRKIPFGVQKAVNELVPKFETVRGPNVWWTWKEHKNWIKE